MKKLFVIILFVIALQLSAQNDSIAFFKGADIGWLSEMEASGYKFYNDSGKEMDCMDILKQHGINSLRFRVWVNPIEKWCGKADVVTMAKRAQAKGFNIMIDFHYSDWWADPGKQDKPATWAADTFEQLKQHVYEHTYEILDSLKQNSIIPKWVQVGNETDNGMIWPDGMASKNMKNYAQLTLSGYNAVKAIDSTIQVIVHLSSGNKNGLYRWIFDGLKTNGAKWDIIGMSLYPYWSKLSWQKANELCIANVKDMMSRYNKKVMICEVGYENTKPLECKVFLIDLQAKLYAAGGLGVFYWEPECYNWKSYNLGAWDAKTKAPNEGMDAFLINPENPLTTKVKKLSYLKSIIYPNPVNQGRLTVKTEMACKTQIKILSMNGVVLYEKVSNTGNLVLNNLKLNPSSYFLLVENEHEKSVQSFIVQ